MTRRLGGSVGVVALVTGFHWLRFQRWTKRIFRSVHTHALMTRALLTW